MKEDERRIEKIVLRSGRVGSTTFKIRQSPQNQRNFMRIRILDPSPRLWYPLEKKNGKYYIAKEKTKQRFVTLDIGALQEVGIQGIAFIRGVPRDQSLSEGDRVKNSDWRSQSIRIEYRSINSSFEEPPKVQTEKALRNYMGVILSFLESELESSIKKLSIIPKGDDFKLIIDSPSLPFRETLKVSSILSTNERNYALQQTKVLPLRKWLTLASFIPERVSENGRYEIRKKRIEAGNNNTLLMNAESLSNKEIAVPLTDIYITMFIEKYKESELNDYEKYSFLNQSKLIKDERNQGYWYQIWMSDTPSEYFEMCNLVDRIKPKLKYDWERNSCGFETAKDKNSCVPHCFTTRKQNVLLGGLGLGILAFLYSLRKDIDKIVVVEMNPHIIKWVSPFLPERIQVIEGDFLEYIKKFGTEKRLKEQYFEKESIDVIVGDIWSNAEEKESRDNLYLKVLELGETYFPSAQQLHWSYENKYDSYVLSKNLSDSFEF